MENFNGGHGRCRSRLWCVVFALFIFSCLLLYFDSSTLSLTKNVVQSINNYVYSVSKECSEKSSLIISENRGEPIVRKAPFDDGVEIVNQIGVEQLDVMKDKPNAVTKPPLSMKEVGKKTEPEPGPKFDTCSGKYIYVHKLPSEFNYDLLKECKTLNMWMDMCHYMSNGGLGPKLDNGGGVFTNTGWFETNQFVLGVIFHNRMKQYKCLTDNSSLASAIYVPFYAGLDVSRYLWGFNTSMRDATSHSLIKWISTRPEWKVLGGKDHFMVAGRITWDFRRTTNNDSDWGNNLMLMPEAKNMTMLAIESSLWHSNDIAIPYPTYFHPSKDYEVSQWQNKMRRQKKKYLFCFAGAQRPHLEDSIRGQIIEQCQHSKSKCRLLKCDKEVKKCHNPIAVMKMFQKSVFCLQPPGDSYTRRSAFDSILAGCIPVFFHPGSAYVQYIWHLPRNYTKYSVLIPADDVRNGKTNIASTLSRISEEDTRAMREEVIRLIPKVIYADPKARTEIVEDAFDIAVKGVLQRVNEVRREMREGLVSNVSYAEENSWKYSLFGTVEKHEWDHFFSKTN